MKTAEYWPWRAGVNVYGIANPTKVLLNFINHCEPHMLPLVFFSANL